MVNETQVTIRGWAGNKPTLYLNDNLKTSSSTAKIASAMVSVGVTPRVFNTQVGKFIDGETVWYSVRCYGHLARNVALSVDKGTPLLVRGKQTTRTYVTKNGAERSSVVLNADAIGIELNTGTATFTRLAHPSTNYSTSSDTAWVTNESNVKNLTESATNMHWEIASEDNELTAVKSVLTSTAEQDVTSSVG